MTILTNQTYPNLVAKIQAYMSNKTQNSNYFSLLPKLGSYKICLTLWQKYVSDYFVVVVNTNVS